MAYGDSQQLCCRQGVADPCPYWPWLLEVSFLYMLSNVYLLSHTVPRTFFSFCCSQSKYYSKSTCDHSQTDNKKKTYFLSQHFLIACNLWRGNLKSTATYLWHFVREILRVLLPFPSTLSFIVSVCQFILGLLQLNLHVILIAIEYLVYFFSQLAYYLYTWSL